MKERKELYIFFIIFSIILLIDLVSAFYLPPVRYAVESTVQAAIDIFEPVLQALLGGTDYSSYLLFEKLLIFLILLGIVYVALGWVPAFEDNKTVKWLIAIIVPLLGVRFLEPGWLLTIIIQYKVLAITLTAILPFIIYFFFLYNIAGDSSAIRKIGWTFFIVVYLGLWATVENESYSSIYFWTMIAALLFLLFDGTIHSYYIKHQMKVAGSATKWEHLDKLRRDIDETQSNIRFGYVPERVGRQLIKKKQRQIKWVMKHG